MELALPATPFASGRRAKATSRAEIKSFPKKIAKMGLLVTGEVEGRPGKRADRNPSRFLERIENAADSAVGMLAKVARQEDLR